MRKLLIVLIILLIAGGIATLLVYKYYVPDALAEAIVANEVPAYLPKRVQNKIKALRPPVNAGAEDVVKRMHDADVPLEKILLMIDNTTEEQMDNLANELSRAPLENTDQAFDIAKKHFTADFDLEILRAPFKENINLKMIQRAIKYRDKGRSNNINSETAKEIAKKILIEKDKELRAK